MKAQLQVRVIDPDPDYLGIEVRASSERFSGTSFIYASVDGLSKLCESIHGFPQTTDDEREHLLGTRKPGWASGFCELRFFCTDGLGHTAIQIELGDDTSRHSDATARFTIETTPAEIDEFITSLKRIEADSAGEAILKTSG